MTVIKEYNNLLLSKKNLEKEYLSLPKGYISKKTIKGNIQYYLQYRNGKKLIGKYIRSDSVDSVKSGIKRRKEIQNEISEINNRIKQLEKATRLIGNTYFCRLNLYKLSFGMDELTTSEKSSCIEFGNTMNSIEGVAASKNTVTKIEKWKKGEKSYISIFEDVLKKHGFPVEDNI